MIIGRGVKMDKKYRIEALEVELQKVQQREINILEELKQLKNESKTEKNLTHDEIKRYSRQLLLPEWGVKTQLKLSRTTKGVLVVGAGGLGCPAVQFMAAAGVTPIGIVDYDEVDVSNLHRQVLHAEHRQGMAKVDSIEIAVKQLNNHVKIIPYRLSLDSSNALDIVSQYDVILDASDNVATRYLLNDACVIANKPLVSGSALRFEGQLTVYNYQGGPTYRCLFPEPPPSETVTNCSDGGVVGVVPGIIGSLQAQETMKILGGFGEVLSGKLLLFDSFTFRFTLVKLRPRSAKADEIKELIDYEQFCGAKATDKESGLKLLTAEDRITVQEYCSSFDNQPNHVLIDVRSEPEMDICKLENAQNFPFSDVDKPDSIERIKKLLNTSQSDTLIVMCRRGNDSQKAVQALKPKLENIVIKDIKGGLYAWSDHVDSNFPKY